MSNQESKDQEHRTYGGRQASQCAPQGVTVLLLAGWLTLVGAARAQTLCEALDSCGLIWVTGGDAIWTGQPAAGRDGIDAATSGVITNNQESWMETTVLGPGTITFWWRVISGAEDYLEFRTNGILSTRISGVVGWSAVTRHVSTGPQTLRWRYTKNGGNSSALLRGLVDQVSFVPDDPLLIQPIDDLISSRYIDGPLNSSSTVYTLTNKSASNLSWSAGADQAWVTVTPGEGSLMPGSVTNVAVQINANAQSLDPGAHITIVTFSNQTSGVPQTRGVQVSVNRILYVNLSNPTPDAPHTNWATAATNIQDAVDAAIAGELILVTNGIYATGGRAVLGTMTNRVAVSKALKLLSVNGPEVTIIKGQKAPSGGNGDGAIRCLYMAYGASVSGFTLANGATRNSGDFAQTRGGGVWCGSTNVLVTNCVLTGNSSFYEGGGSYSGTINNCLLTGNSSDVGGGGSFEGTLNHCTLSGNSAYDGGGSSRCTLNHCTLSGNLAYHGGGSSEDTLNYCTLTGNSAYWRGGGSDFSGLNGCTLTGNAAHTGGGASYGTVNNCIVYYNTSLSDDPIYCTFNYSCITPDLGSGVGNMTNEPAFVDLAGGNLRLQSNSPCINAGNNAYVTASTDLDGRPRVLGGTVDIGAYEWRAIYVSAASTNPMAPYSSWASAAVTIQDAVDAAVAGDEIVVTNGVYQIGARAVYGMSNRVAVTKPVTVRSVNGPAYSSILGHGPIGYNAIRCAYLTNGAVLAGFTLTNGATQLIGDSEMDSITNSGGGIWCESESVVITNCVLAGNTASSEGGGAYSGTLHNCIVTRNYAGYAGGGAAQSTLINSTLTNNSASIFGGAAIASALVHCALTGNGAEIGGGAAYSSRLTNCTVMSNSVYSIVTAFNYGGGVASSTLENCLVMGNSAWDENGVGGGAHASTLNNCTLRGNFAHGGAGAILSTLNNCLVVENLAARDGCGGGAALSTLNNCTLTGNSASYGGGCCSSTLNNCIVYDNNARASGDNYTSGTFNYSCTTPDPESGVGNITNAPLFVDLAGGNLRLQSNSPCINAGNNACVTAATDLDGLPRISGGTVDMGAYEFQSPASTISYAWLQQFAMPIDGSADDIDTDHDGHNNWQEWMAGTDPTNALSALRLAAPLITPTNVILTWTSVTNRTYTLEQATNLAGAPAFSVLRSNLAGLPGTTSWTDTNAPVSSPRFYQLRVSR